MAFAQTDPIKHYQTSWDSIQALNYEGKTKTALTVAQNLYSTMDPNSKDPKIIAAQIKTFLLIQQNQAHLEEDGFAKALLRIEAEGTKAQGIKRAVLHSLSAHLYDDYLQSNLWKIRNRTATEDFNPEDVRTWDIERLTRKIYTLYQESIKDLTSRKVPIKEFAPLLNVGINATTLRPTLYDVLLHRALDYYKSGRLHLTRPSYQFYVDDPKDFAPAGVFSQHILNTEDHLSPEFQALKLYQEGLRHHTGNTAPLVDLDLQRLAFIRQKSILPNKDALYEERLLALHQRYITHEASASIAYELAQLYYQQGQTYHARNNPSTKLLLKKAHRWCMDALEQHPKSYGAECCKRLIEQIERPSLNMQTERVNAIGQNSLILLNYRNLSTVYLRIVKFTDAIEQNMNGKYGEDRVKYLTGLKPIQVWSNALPNEQDYQECRTELPLAGLPHGRYLVLASAKGNFSHQENVTVYTTIHVSNLRLLSNSNNYTNRYYVTHGITGEPLANVSAEFYTEEYNSLLRRYTSKRLATTISDDLGSFETPAALANRRNYYSYSIRLKTKDDALRLDNNFYQYEQSPKEERQQTHFFLDRAIYRPGQLVYFKGLVLDYPIGEKVPRVVKKQRRTITFYDANSQKIADVEVTTNEYGSFNGSFTAPGGGLLGQMYLQDSHNNSSAYLRVEEYKRPKFEVTALPLTKAYNIDDTVQVQGQAKAYAGNVIDGAKVTYTVTRQVNFPYWRWYWGWHLPQISAQQITTGETTTDGDGKYTIEFAALPDRTVDPKHQPEFIYTIQATVTDVTGETHSATSTVHVGYVSLQVALNVPDRISTDDWKNLSLSTNNLNGQFEATQGMVKIERLQTPSIVYKKRYWERPELYAMDEAAFKEKFPYYAYKDEDEPTTWKVAQQVYQTQFETTEATTELSLKSIKNWIPGTYKVTLNTTDKAGNAIELVKLVIVYKNKGNQVPNNDALFLTKTNFDHLKPNSTVILDVGSYHPDAYILYELEHNEKIVERRWLRPKGRTTVKIPIKEAYRGGVGYHLTSVLHGRFYHQTGHLSVPWDNKKLNLSFKTFRDKLRPGQDETWTIKISGEEKDRVTAEVLASMYDASLDAFTSHGWTSSFLPSYYPRLALDGGQGFQINNGDVINGDFDYSSIRELTYPYLDWGGLRPDSYAGGMLYLAETANVPKPSRSRSKRSKSAAVPQGELEEAVMLDKMVTDQDEARNTTDEKPSQATKEENPSQGDDLGEVAVRTNLKETVFFFPELKTDKDGNVLIEFKMNEALTKWRLMLFAHSQDLDVGYAERYIVTQKELMVVPNPPRFFRESDQLEFTAKVSNLTEDVMQGEAQLLLFDALTMQPVNDAFGINASKIKFEAKAGGSARLAWDVQVPNSWVRPIIHRVVAKAGKYADGEEAPLPVLTNRMLVTETQPLPLRGNQTKTFEFERMKAASQSSTLQQHKLTLEFTQNPAWYAIQSLPYLMEYPHECTEQVFSRYYANSLASHVANSHPKIKRVFEQWRAYEPEALKSNLMKNEALKYAILEETPWVLQAQSESQQKRNVGLLFDLNKMGNELGRAKKKLLERQLANGGFSWMPGGRDSWYITQYLVEGFGHLDALGVASAKKDPALYNMLKRAVNYIDGELASNYARLLKAAKKSGDAEEHLKKDHLSSTIIHYFYARSFFTELPIANESQKAFEYYTEQSKKHWNKPSRYLQALLGLGLHRFGNDKETPQKIVTAARENALHSDEMGMYWKYHTGYFWYQLPIETHSVMIELFDVVAKDPKAVDDLKVWLLKRKQTTHWKTTKATASACYALLATGDNWLLEDKDVSIQLGEQVVDVANIPKEAGTGYFKTTWDGDAIQPEMATIKVTNPNKNVAWGALYWQYFEQMDKITHFKETPLKIDKQLFKEVPGDRGPVLKPITKEELAPGDKIVVRIELRVDRPMEYVHMKDHRASGFEPINVLSQYKWQDGLGYYESTRDAATNFFFGYLPKGTHVFEYPLRVNLKGDFSNGITTIQCMYAPEFTAHSEGIRVTIE